GGLGGGFPPIPQPQSPVPASENPTIHVACGVLVNAQGEVLLAQRPEGKIAAGWWEFPGGKIEQGESALQALTRELHEELGVTVRQAAPLIRFRHKYSNRTIVLDTWRVTVFDGEPRGCEGQALRWLSIRQFADVAPLLPTVVPIERALRMPAHYVFTPPQNAPGALLAGLAQLPPAAWLRLRQPSLDEAQYEVLARQLVPAADALGIKVFLDRDPAQVAMLGAAGWHGTSAKLMRLSQRPDTPFAVASVHDAAQLAHAVALGFDAAVLGPVLATPTHPGAETLGWAGFSAVRSAAPLPVFAIGGLDARQLDAARAANAQGIAGISAYWR
ncbi:MAG: Nudix family hydrolase, partial [Stagnimonas sp.]|nr:Nudix family hydrolase [Stagnimonas sp.]